MLLDDGGIDRKVSEYMQSLLRERFTNKMLEIVDELQVAYSHHDLVRGTGSVFPVRAGKCVLFIAFLVIATRVSRVSCAVSYNMFYSVKAPAFYFLFAPFSLFLPLFHRFAPAAEQPCVGVCEGSDACDGAGPIAGSGGGFTQKTAAHSGKFLLK